MSDPDDAPDAMLWGDSSLMVKHEHSINANTMLARANQAQSHIGAKCYFFREMFYQLSGYLGQDIEYELLRAVGRIYAVCFATQQPATSY